MSSKLFKYEVIGFVFTSIGGTIAHFLYELSGYNEIIGLFCSVNESVWEHLKLLFFPFMLYAVFEYFILSKPKGFFGAKLIAILAGMAVTVGIYYIYNGAVGSSPDWLNIASFFIGVGVAYLTGYAIIKNKKEASAAGEIISVILIIAIGASFALFTIYPPFIPLFEDPRYAVFGRRKARLPLSPCRHPPGNVRQSLLKRLRPPSEPHRKTPH